MTTREERIAELEAELAELRVPDVEVGDLWEDEDGDWAHISTHGGLLETRDIYHWTKDEIGAPEFVRLVRKIGTLVLGCLMLVAGCGGPDCEILVESKYLECTGQYETRGELMCTEACFEGLLDAGCEDFKTVVSEECL